MKTLKYYVLIMFTCLVFAACTNNEYQIVIPKDASVVVSFNLKELLADVDIPEKDMDNLKSLMGAVFNGQDKDKINEMVSGDEPVGIDFSEPIYAFVSEDNMFGLSMKVSSDDDLDNLFEILDRQHLCDKPKEKDGFRWTTIIDDFQVAYNGNTLLICGGVNEKGMKKMFDNDEENSFMATPNFEKMEANKAPVQIFTSLKNFQENDLTFLTELLPEGVKAADVNLLTSLVLNKGQADINGELFSNNEKTQNLLIDADKNFKKINGDFIKAPENFLLWMGAGMKGEEALKKLKSMDDTNGLLMMMDRAIDIQKIIKSIDGDMTIVIPELPNDEPTSFVLMAKTANTDFLKDVNYWQEQMKDWNLKMTENDKNSYTLFLDDDFSLNWGVDNKNVFFSSPNTDYKKTFAETNAILDEQAADIKNSIFYVCLNLMPVYQKFNSYMDSEFDKETKDLVKDIEFPFDKVVFKANNAHSCSLSFSLKNKEQGVLNALFDFYTKMSGLMMKTLMN